jgi:hypothetical protein
MRGIAFFILLSVAACVARDARGPEGMSSEVRGWQEVSGKTPSQAEFAAVVAACQDRAESTDKGVPIDDCLIDLGLRRVQ